MASPPLVLASTSPFRRALLERLGIPFITAKPDVDETMHPGETPRDLVLRLCEAKARSAAESRPDALVIGSDQVACIDELVLGKPGDRARAIEQLRRSSGREVVFYTGLCLLNAARGRAQTACEPFRVHFRKLSHRQIEGYLDRERPFDCAGSFKSEGLGIALFDRLEGDDPNTLVGLPLIRLIAMLEWEGIDLLAPLGSRSHHGRL
jgi:septum formation protein